MTLFLRYLRYMACFIVLLSSISSYAAPPRWLRYVPKADNPTYRYVIEQATGADEEAAHSKAVAAVLQHAIMSLGLPFNSNQVNTAMTTGTLVSKMAEWKIPVNEVCRYTQVYEGGVRVHVLFQVAVAGNITVDFTPFRNCGNTRDKVDDQMYMRPDEWNIYEMDTYFSSSEELDVNNEMSSHDFKVHLENLVKETLVNELALTDSSLIQLIKTKFHVTKKVGYAIAYMEREWVNKKYMDDVDSEVNICYGLLESAESYIEEKNVGEAKAILARVSDLLVDIEPMISFLNAYSSSRSVDRYIEDVKDIKKQINEKMMRTMGNTQRAKEGKVREYMNLGKDVLSRYLIGDALRYFYAAQLLLMEIPDNDYIVVEDEHLKSEVRASIYIPNKISEILKNIQITCDGYLPENNSNIKLSFRYQGTPVTNMNYWFQSNNSWGDLLPVKDGWSFVTLPEGTKPTKLTLRVEYRYEDDANFDAELPILMKKYKEQLDYDNYAKNEIVFVNTPTRVVAKSSMATSRLTTDISQNYVASRIEEDRHKVSDLDAMGYHDRIMQVCSAIQNQSYQSVFTLFTMSGYEQFEKLIKYGKARVVSTEGCKYIRVGTDVQCRSIPMNFSFTKGKQELENVVFTFNSQGKIDGIQFALEERSARNVMGNVDIDEVARLTLINFLENYKTAFALKRIDYIESIFSEDAVIITGRVLRKTEQTIETQQNQITLDNILYTRMSKGEYIKRLKISFASKEWINVKFGNTAIDSSLQDNTYGIRLVQDYSSSNYGDHGYLFLLVDTSDKEKPIIRVRTWQPDLDSAIPFTIDDYDRMTSGQM